MSPEMEPHGQGCGPFLITLLRSKTFDLLRYVAFAYSFEGSIPTKRNTLSLPAGRQVFREVESFGSFDLSFNFLEEVRIVPALS